MAEIMSDRVYYPKCLLFILLILRDMGNISDLRYLRSFLKEKKSFLGRKERKEEYSRAEEKDAKPQNCDSMRSVT